MMHATRVMTYVAVLLLAMPGAALAASSTNCDSSSDQVSHSSPWFKDVGSGRPIIFLHGWTMDHRDEELEYEPIFSTRPGWRRIYIDLPGMGQTPIGNVTDQETMLAAVLCFIEERIGSERFSIAGTSAGGYLARGIINRRPEQIAGVLLRMPLVIPEDDLREVSPPAVLIAGGSQFHTLPKPQRERHDATIVQTPDYMAALDLKTQRRVEPAIALADRRSLDKIRRDPSRYALKGSIEHERPVLVPSLIVTGRNDTSVGYRDAWRLVSQFQRATYVALDRAEHGFPIDEMNRRLFRSLVADWLERVEEFGAIEAAKR